MALQRECAEYFLTFKSFVLTDRRPVESAPPAEIKTRHFGLQGRGGAGTPINSVPFDGSRLNV